MSNFDPSVIARAAQRLVDGDLVAFPTETVYGLGANALSGEAVARIFEAKGRPRFNPLIVHVADADVAHSLCHFPDEARVLANAFWPGPLTLVLSRKSNCDVSELVSAGLPTLAVRVPAHPIAHALLMAAGVPVAAPSANTSGHVSATRAEHVRADLSLIDESIVDGGATPLGIESTIVSVIASHEVVAAVDVAILRIGAIESAEIERVLGRVIVRQTKAQDFKATAPGQLASHYAPQAALRLNATSAKHGEGLIAFGPCSIDHDGPSVNLSVGGDLVEAAANLFAALRDMDARGVSSIAVVTIPDKGLGEAINDRLARAAVPNSTGS